MSPGQSPKSFMPVLTIPGEKWTCAVDDPSSVMSLSGVGGFPDMAQCALQCTGDVGCRGFNVKIDARLMCEIYSHIPRRFALVPGCEYRHVSTAHFSLALQNRLYKFENSVLGISVGINVAFIWIHLVTYDYAEVGLLCCCTERAVRSVSLLFIL